MTMITYLRLIVFIQNAASATSFSAQKEIQWQPYSTGMSSAHNNSKAVFLHFYATWCSYCRKMERESFQNNTVIDLLNEKFISIRVDVENEKEIRDEFKVFALPTTYIFSSKGEKMGPVLGYISKDSLLKMLRKE